MHVGGLSHFDTKNLDNKVASELRKIITLNEIEPFALDLGTYLWVNDTFAAARQDSALRHTIQIGRADVSQVMSFVFNWILRWESFTAMSDTGRWERWRAELLAPTTDNPELGSRLINKNIEVQVPKPNPFKPEPSTTGSVELQLADLPPISETEFMTIMNSLLARHFSGLPESAVVAGGGRVLVRGIRADTDFAAVVSAIDNAAGSIDQVRNAAADARKEWDEQREPDVAPLREALKDLTVDDTAVFASFVATEPPAAGSAGQAPEVIAVFSKPITQLTKTPAFSNAFNTPRAIENGLRCPGPMRYPHGVYMRPGSDPAEVTFAVQSAVAAVKKANEDVAELTNQHEALVARIDSGFRDVLGSD